VGAAGLGLGTGTAAILRDGTYLRESVVTGGTVDMTVAWETEEDSGTAEGDLAVPVELTPTDPSSTVRVRTALPEYEGQNNPGYAWMGAPCPDEQDSLWGNLAVTIRYSDCSEECSVFEGTLADLASGVPLDGEADGSRPAGQQTCLEPGESLDLELEVTLDRYAVGDAEFVLQFVATQCRHGEPVSPFPADPACRAGPEHAISFVAFCTRTEGALDPTLATTAENDDGEPLEVDWETAVDVDFVVLKAAREVTIYDHRDGEVTAGTAAPGDGGANVETVVPAGSSSSDPCELASAVVTDGSYESTNAVKLEYADGDWEADS
jgi:hypothetical protein